MTQSAPAVPLPDGVDDCSDWTDYDDEYRVLWGRRAEVDHNRIVVQPSGLQRPDGSIDMTDDAPQVWLSQMRKGEEYDCFTVSLKGAGELAAALLSAVALVEGWAK